MIRFPFSHVFLCAFFSLAASALLAQSVPPPPPPPPPPGATTDKQAVLDTNEVFNAVEDHASFPGGDAALMSFLGKNIQFPQRCKDSAYAGTVYMKFIVERDGSISNIRPLREQKKCPELAEECGRVLSIMPRWRPGHVQGVPVRCECIIPIRVSVR